MSLFEVAIRSFKVKQQFFELWCLCYEAFKFTFRCSFLCFSHVVRNRAKFHLVFDERQQWLFSVCSLNAVKENVECHSFKSCSQTCSDEMSKEKCIGRKIVLHFTNVQIVERLKRFKWRRSISKQLSVRLGKGKLENKFIYVKIARADV